jgi:amino acid adenylation domain-containing protein
MSWGRDFSRGPQYEVHGSVNFIARSFEGRSFLQSLNSVNASDNRTVQAIFEKRAELNPDAPAVYAADGACWSYAHLDKFANQIAHRLLKMGCTTEQRVGVCMQRSPETVGVLLGILKARAAYVPLDLNLPQERLKYIVGDAMARQIFVDQAGQSKLINAGVQGVEVLSATDNRDFPEHSPNLPASSRDLANILYTSGSTGRPKGAMLEHSGVLRLVLDTTWLKYSAQDVFLQISALSFDLSTFEIWGPLLNGGCLVTAPQSPAIREIGDLLEKFKVTTLWLTAGLFNVVMEEQPEAIKGLQHLLTGGDIASPRHARLALAHLERGELINCYGPTENATFSTCHRVTNADTEQPSIPIGLAVDKSPVHLLDESLKPIRDHRVGEIFVGGEGLSRGYWNRPELTAEKFLEIEIEPGLPQRLYRTGDLGRYNDAGFLEFVGRTDFQVKIRGFRIEPEEIELALSSMSGLASAAVVTKGADADTKVLCCYYVRNNSRQITADAIKSFLAVQFPDYMIPSIFRELISLPLNTNGKVDRKALESLAMHNGNKPSVSSQVDSPTAQIREQVQNGVKTVPKTVGRGDGGPNFGFFAPLQKALHKANSALHRVLEGQRP